MHCVKHVLTPSWRTGHPIIHPSITSSQLFFLHWQNDTRLQLCSPGATRVPGHLSRKVKIQVDSLGTFCSLRSYGKLPKLTNFKMADPQQSPDFCLLRRRIGSWIHPQLAPEVLRRTSFQLGSSRYSCQHKDKYFLWNKWFKIKIRLELVLSKTLFLVTTLLGAIEDCRNVCMHKYLLHALKNILFVLASREPTVVTPKWIWLPCLPMSSHVFPLSCLDVCMFLSSVFILGVTSKHVQTRSSCGRPTLCHRPFRRRLTFSRPKAATNLQKLAGRTKERQS